MNPTSLARPIETVERMVEDEELVEYDGELYRRHWYGGLVALTAMVDERAMIAKGARVSGRARVHASARLFHDSVVEDDAHIGPLVTLRENARIGGSAILTMGTIVRGDAYVGGTSVITGCTIEGRARVIDVTLSGAYTLR